jgi:hypothetical protein
MGDSVASSSISRSLAPAARSTSPYTSPSTAVAPARMITYTTVCPRWPALMLPCSTACVPWYRPHSSAPEVAVMMKATSTERALLRPTAVWKAAAVEALKRLASRSSAV